MRLIMAIGILLSTSAAFGQVEIEGKTYHTGYLPRPVEMVLSTPYRVPTPEQIAGVPESYDAREDGLVTPTKNQGQCGSCWAFARTKAFEAALIKAGQLPDSGDIDLAEQDTLVNDPYSYGCSGGFMDGRYEVSKGQTTEDLCPYRTSDRYSCRAAKFAKATKWAMIGAANRAPSVDELKAAIYEHGVIAVTVSAGGAFSPDREGRITRCSNGQINHMVTLAGYRPTADGGTEFLIGNSWGKSWGVDGFAWSKQGCNRLASSPGDAALYFYVE